MRLISGIQPSGTITLGNYLGAIKNFVKLQDDPKFDDFLVFVADLHAITVPQDRTKLRQNIKSLAAIYLACGLDPKKVHIFIQSEVPAHPMLAWILQCNGYIGEFERMTQFKSKSQAQKTNSGIPLGLLTYPSLMAGDILLYDANAVPVGQDQTQHLEITRDLAVRFNSKYGDTFVVPEALTTKQGAKINSLTDPTKKMSNSDPNPKSYVSLLDDVAVIRNKIKGAVTDSDTKIKYDPDNKPGVSNLLTILSCVSGKSIQELEEEYKDSNYAQFKADVADAVVNEIEPIQARYNELINSEELDKILDEGRDYATYLSNKKISKVLQKVGLGRKRK
jgi:tryptophanyl-tRNA synthetase